MSFKGTGILFHCVRIPCEKKPCSRSLFPWMEVNSDCPLVISVAVGVCPWTVGGKVYCFPATIHTFTIMRVNHKREASRGGEVTVCRLK